MNVLVISNNRPFWEALFPAFTQNGLHPSVVDTLEKGLETIRLHPPKALVLDLPRGADKDKSVHENEVRSALIATLQINAFVHTAVVSFLEEEDFHDAFEGFGVLCHLPPVPGEPDVKAFAETLFRVIRTMPA